MLPEQKLRACCSGCNAAPPHLSPYCSCQFVYWICSCLNTAFLFSAIWVIFFSQFANALHHFCRAKFHSAGLLLEKSHPNRRFAPNQLGLYHYEATRWIRNRCTSALPPPLHSPPQSPLSSLLQLSNCGSHLVLLWLCEESSSWPSGAVLEQNIITHSSV